MSDAVRAPRWVVRRLTGAPAALFAASGPPVSGETREARVLTPDREVIVLGSGQHPDIGVALRHEGSAHADTGGETGEHRSKVEVVRRRSGGAAVLVGAPSMLWIDVAVPSADPLWDADIIRGARWIGEWWVGVLSDSGLDVSSLGAHMDRAVSAPWSDVVCFAGLGPGEVSVATHKVVGVSQRRTRTGTLFQCGVLIVDEQHRLPSLLMSDAQGREQLAPGPGVASLLGVDAQRAYDVVERCAMRSLSAGGRW